MNGYFDTHAHYDDAAFDADREELFAAMERDGVTYVINPGCDGETSRRAVSYAAKYPYVYAAVGWHPENCADFTDLSIEEIAQLARQEKVVAIGEIGLDYHWAENPPPEQQKRTFRAHLELALALHLPVIVHDRDAHADTLAMVEKYPQLRGVFHCYSGSVEMAQRLLDRGWYLGFDGPLTYKNARKTVEVAAMVPSDRYLLETDSPYLTPVPHRGQRNDSRMLRHIAARMAEIRGVDIETVMEQSMENGKRLFLEK